MEIERTIKDALKQKDTQTIRDIIDTLCKDYAYAVHQPNARNGGLIGLAAAAIALGQVCYYYMILSLDVIILIIDVDF